MTDQRKVWEIEHPTYRFKEDVKELAAANRLKIIDPAARAAAGLGPIPAEFKISKEKAPKLTLKDEFKPKKS
jgi:hypothetical protein